MIYLELRSRLNGANNGKPSLAREEDARPLRITRATVGRVFDELEDKGFIVKTKQGRCRGGWRPNGGSHLNIVTSTQRAMLSKVSFLSRFSVMIDL
jgi:DNA-binding transcriptional MocR family regulator